MTNSTDPWSFVINGDYQKAIAIFTQLIKGEGNFPYYHNRGLAYLLSNNYHLALEDFRYVISNKNPNLLADSDMIFVGVCYWFLNDPDQAIESWHLSVSAPYTDQAGGIKAAALLLYGAARIKDKSLMREAYKLLEVRWDTYDNSIGQSLSRQKDIPSWPGEIAPFLLGKLSKDSFEHSTTQNELWRSIQSQKKFYLGLKHFIEKDIPVFKQEILSCFEIDYRKLGFEYYLAKWEIDMQFPQLSGSLD